MNMTTSMKAILFGLLVIAALALVACGPAASEPEAPAAAPTAAMVPDDAAMAEGETMEKDDPTMAEDETMAKEDDAAMVDGHDAGAEDEAAMADDDAMAKDDTAMAEGDAMAKEDEASQGEGHDAMAESQAAMADDDAMAKDDVTGAEDDTMQPDDAAMALPAWLTAQLVDVNAGQTFAIADHKGKVVLVETLAVWCSNCLRQQQQVQALHEDLGEHEDLVSVGLDIDLNESAEQLRAHAERNGFDWVYAVATPEVAREIGQLYGNLFLNPPSTPMLIVDRQGEVHPLPFGIKSAGDLQAALAPFLAEAM